MTKHIKIDLMSNDVEDFIKKLRELKKEVKTVNQNIIEELGNLAETEISSSLSGNTYKGNKSTTVYRTKEKIGIQGEQAIYEEFGTGTVGQNSPHPLKDDVEGLNPYNSGKTIRPNTGINSSGTGLTEATKRGIPLNGMYWTYMDGDKKIYTQGIPAGLHVYKGFKTIQKNFKAVSKKKVGEWLSKL